MQNQGGLISGMSIAALHNRTLAAPTVQTLKGKENSKGSPQVRQRA